MDAITICGNQGLLLRGWHVPWLPISSCIGDPSISSCSIPHVIRLHGCRYLMMTYPIMTSYPSISHYTSGTKMFDATSMSLLKNGTNILHYITSSFHRCSTMFSMFHHVSHCVHHFSSCFTSLPSFYHHLINLIHVFTMFHHIFSAFTTIFGCFQGT